MKTLITTIISILISNPLFSQSASYLGTRKAVQDFSLVTILNGKRCKNFDVSSRIRRGFGKDSGDLDFTIELKDHPDFSWIMIDLMSPWLDEYSKFETFDDKLLWAHVVEASAPRFTTDAQGAITYLGKADRISNSVTISKLSDDQWKLSLFTRKGSSRHSIECLLE